MSACLLKFLSLGISLCSDYANFTAQANSFALPRIERLGRQGAACDCTCTCSYTYTHSHTQTRMQSGQLNTYSTAHYVCDRGPDGRHSLYHIVIGSHQENHTSLVLQQSNWTDVFPMRHFLSHIGKQFSLQIPLSVSTDCSKQALCKHNDIFLDAYNQTANNYSSSLCR